MKDSLEILLRILFCLPLLYIVFEWLINNSTFSGTQITVCIILAALVL